MNRRGAAADLGQLETRLALSAAAAVRLPAGEPHSPAYAENEAETLLSGQWNTCLGIAGPMVGLLPCVGLQ